MLFEKFSAIHALWERASTLWRTSRVYKCSFLAATFIFVGVIIYLVFALAGHGTIKPITGSSGNNPFTAMLSDDGIPDDQSMTTNDSTATGGSGPTTSSDGSTVEGGSNNGTASGGGSGGGSACSAGTHVAGGSDGAGGCWPGPNNTGVPAGTVLSAYSGPCVITAAGTVIDSKTVNCDLSIQAANVTIKNTKVNGTVIVDVDRPGSSSWSLLLQDTEVDTGTQQLSAIGWGNFTVIRAKVHGGQTSIQCEENSVSCTIQDSYLYGQYIPDDQPWHLGGFLSDGTQNLTIKHNFIICDQPVNSVSEGCTGDLNLIPNFAPISGALIEHNLFGANIGSSYCTYGGEKASSPTPHSDHVVYKDNIFQRGTNSLCAAYGPVTGFDVNQPGNQWINNRWTDGTIVDPAN